MKEPLTLLPQPQKIQYSEGAFKLAAEPLIVLDGGADALAQAGQILQEALSNLGAKPELTAAWPGDRPRVAASVRICPEQISRPEGYILQITPERVWLTARDAAGAFYGAQTLRQIVRQASGGCLPCVRIEDWPDFAHRGVMLDISRDKVPSQETLKALVDRLAEWKVNQFQLYIEHTFAYHDHRVVWAEASPVTGEEMLELDGYCRARHMELVPNQNSFGHMGRWLKHEPYRHLSEMPETPFTLCPLDPEALGFLGKLYDEFLPHFTSRQFNVGCDETFELGKGRSRQAAEERGLGRVYLDFLLKIHAMARSHGRTMQFWGDIILQHPELIPELPGDLIAMCWGYGAGHPYPEQTRRFAEAGVPFYVCPGTSSWSTLIGRTDNMRTNILSAADSGLTNGAIGLLNTDWGDHGHWQHLPISFAGFAFGAAASWCVSSNREIDLTRALDLHAFEDKAGVMGSVAYDLGNTYQLCSGNNLNWTSMARFMIDPEDELGKDWMDGVTAQTLETSISAVEKQLERMQGARMARPDADLIKQEFENNSRLAIHGCHLALARLRSGAARLADLPEAERKTLAAELAPLIEEYRKTWLARHRLGGLNDSARRFEDLLAIYQGKQTGFYRRPFV